MARANPNHQQDRINHPGAEPPSTLGATPPIAGAPAAPVHALGDPSGDGRTFVQTIGSGPIQEYNPENLPQKDGMVLPPTQPRIDFSNGPREEPPVIDRYVVTADFLNGTPRYLRGKVVDTLNYDIKMLLRAGVKLRCLTKDKDGNRLDVELDPADILLTN